VTDKVILVTEVMNQSMGVEMIQCRLRELIAAKGRRERRKITYEHVRKQTGINKNTMARLANDRAYLIAISTIDRLCAYFDCQPGDLFVYVPESGIPGEPAR